MVRFDQDLETHYAPIDEDHQRLVALLEAFIATIDKRQRVLALKALNAVADQVATHFAFEEHLMAECRYRQLTEHQEAHQSFLRDVHKFQRELDKKGLTESVRLWGRGRLLSWFRLHVKAHDAALAKALKTFERK